MKKNIVLSLLFCGSILFLDSCKKDDDQLIHLTKSYSNQVATDWFDMTRELTKLTPGFSPPVASRAFGYCGVALYQSVLPGMSNYNSLEGQLNGLSSISTKVKSDSHYNWEISANACMAKMCRLIYPTTPDSMKLLIDNLEMKTLNRISIGSEQEVIDRSIAFGIGVANDIFEWSKTDGGHESYSRNFPSNYVVPVGPGLWEPTSAQKIPMQPFWGENRSFVPNDILTSQPNLTITYSTDTSSAFYKQALNVYETGVNLSEDKIIIAKYWSDDPGLPGTPPGHSISILNQVIKTANLDLSISAELYAKVGIALSDAFVGCWKCKYTYNLIRPVSYINQNIDPNWKPLLSTPPFPEFTSGHSTQSGAFAKVMTDFFGEHYGFTDRTHSNRFDINGLPRTFTSFKEMAAEAAASRLYGGIHFNEANSSGLIQGDKIGQSVISVHWKK